MLTTLSDTLLRAGSRIPLMRQPLVRTVSREAADILAVGDGHNWPFRVLGRAPMVDSPIYTGDWWVMPVQHDNSPMPARAVERARALYEAGVRPKGFVIAHEVPKLLAPAKSDSPPTPWWRRLLMQFASKPAYLAAAVVVLVIVGPILLELLLKTLLIVAAILALPFAIFGLGAVAMADPVLVAVTEDNVWVEIDRWE